MIEIGPELSKTILVSIGLILLYLYMRLMGRLFL